MARIKVDSSDSTVKAIIKASFPDYRGRKVYVDPSDRPVDVRSYWSGDSRDYFTVVDMRTLRAVGVPQNGTPYEGGPISQDGVIPPVGYAIVEHSFFCGKDAGITIHVHPDSMPRLLTTMSNVVLLLSERIRASYLDLSTLGVDNSSIKFRRLPTVMSIPEVPTVEGAKSEFGRMLTSAPRSAAASKFHRAYGIRVHAAKLALIASCIKSGEPVSEWDGFGEPYDEAIMRVVAFMYRIADRTEEVK